MQRNKVTNQAEAQPGAAFIGLGVAALVKRLEYPFTVGLGDADAGVGDGEDQVIVFAPGFQANGAAFRGECGGVGEQIEYIVTKIYE